MNRTQVDTLASKRRAVKWWTFLFLVLLLYGPPVLRDLPVVARGVKLDHLLLLATFLVLVVTRPKLAQKAIASRVGFTLLLFCLSSFISAVLSVCFLDASLLSALAAVWGFSRPFLTYVVVYSLLYGAPVSLERNTLNILLGLGVGVSLIGIAQYFQVSPVIEVTETFYGRKHGQELVSQALRSGRVYSTFDGQPNSFGTFSVLVGALALVSYLHNGGWFRLSLMALPVLGLALSWSRGAYAGLFAAMAVSASLIRRFRQIGRLVMLAAAAVIVFWMVPQSVIRIQQLLKLQSYGGESIFDARLVYWLENLRLIKLNPFFGVMGIPTAPFDSLFVGLLTTHGIVGSMIFLLSIVSVLVECRRRQTTFCKGLIAGTFGLLVNGVSSPSFFGERVAELYWFMVALALAPKEASHSTRTQGLEFDAQ